MRAIHNSSARLLGRFAVALVTQLAFVACGNDSPSGTPVASSVVVSTGSSQSVIAGVAASTPLSVKVLDQNGAPVSGVTVLFAVTSGEGAVAPSATTNSLGIASTTYTAGFGSSGAVVVKATYGSLPAATFSITVVPRYPTSIAATGGSGQTIGTGATATNALSVKLLDQLGVPIGGVTVNWSVTSGGGTLASATSITNLSGNATNTYTAGATAGSATVSASASDLTAVTFSETIITRAPTTLSIVSGTGQSARVNESIPNPLVVKLVDQTGTPMPNVAISFNVSSGNGNVSATTVVTNASGLASTGYTAGAVFATSVVTASVPGLTPVNFTIPVTAFGINVISVVSGDNQSTTPNTPLLQPLVVKVLDVLNAPVVGVVVTFTIVSGSGTLSSPTVLTSGNGTAAMTYTAGSAIGNSLISASILGNSIVTFTAVVKTTP